MSKLLSTAGSSIYNETTFITVNAPAADGDDEEEVEDEEDTNCCTLDNPFFHFT